jgi:hypothetical protein
MSLEDRVKWPTMPGYNEYESDEAFDLATWAMETPNRILALKRKRVADRMEDRKRKSSLFSINKRPHSLKYYYLNQKLKHVKKSFKRNE